MARFLIVDARFYDHLNDMLIAGAGAPERVAAALSLGADYGVDYRAENLTARVLALTDGRGVDVVFENIADPVLFPQAFHAIARHGGARTSCARIRWAPWGAERCQPSRSDIGRWRRSSREENPQVRDRRASRRRNQPPAASSPASISLSFFASR